MERERITISIKKDLLKEIDATIDSVKIRNRSHAIETLATTALQSGNTKNAVLLLGGDDAMKLIPIAKSNLKYLKKYDFNTVYIAVGYLAEKIKEKLGDGSDFGLTLRYVEEGEGSGGAVKQLRKVFDKTFVVINSTHEISNDLDKLINYHRKFRPSVTIAADNLSKLSGIYIIEPEIFGHLPAGFSMLESDIFPKLASNDKIAIYPAL